MPQGIPQGIVDLIIDQMALINTDWEVREALHMDPRAPGTRACGLNPRVVFLSQGNLCPLTH